MLSGILQSHRAVQVNIAIMRAFVRMRRMLVSHEELARKVAALEGKYDSQFRVVGESGFEPGTFEVMTEGRITYVALRLSGGHFGCSQGEPSVFASN